MCLPISSAQHKYHEYVQEILELEVFKDSILKKAQVADGKKEEAASQRTAACNPKSRQADNDDSVIQ